MNAGVEDGTNPRELEIAQICKLLSLIADVLYVGKFNPEIGVNRIERKVLEGKDTDITDAQLIAYRMSKEEIVYAWVPYLLQVIKMYFMNTGAMDYRETSPFQKKFPDQIWNNLQKFMNNLYNLPLWKDRSMAGTHFSGKKNPDFWRKVFQTGKTPEGVSVLAQPVNYIELIK